MLYSGGALADDGTILGKYHCPICQNEKYYALSPDAERPILHHSVKASTPWLKICKSAKQAFAMIDIIAWPLKMFAEYTKTKLGL